MAKKKKKKKAAEYISGYRLTDYINWMYLLLMFTGYVLILDDKYFNITITKAKFFIYTSVSYILLQIAAYIIEHTLAAQYGLKKMTLGTEFSDKKRFMSPAYWMIAFAAANTFALVVSKDKTEALYGESGVRMGWIMYIVIAAVFFVLYQRVKITESIYYFFIIATLAAYYIALRQHFGYNIFHLRDKLSSKYYNIYISTFGNINIYSSFICIFTGAMIGLFIFGEKLVPKIVSGIMLIYSGMMIMISNSDGAYFGIGVLMIVMFFMVITREKLIMYLGALSCLAVGNLSITIMNRIFKPKFADRGGIAQALDNVNLALVLAIFAVSALAVSIAVKYKLKDRIDKLNVKKVRNVCLAVFGIALTGVVIYGIASGASIFKFNYDWGTKRGYIWAKCGELFKDADPVNKIFGYGNESIRELMKSNYYDEMIEVTQKVYTNAHNELLQYLVTTGLVGLISYLALVITSLIYMIKNAWRSPAIYVSICVVIAYFTQSLINLNQPITTPIYFVFMALGIGIVRYKKKEEQINE